MKHFFWTNIFKPGKNEIELIADLWEKTPLFKGIPARHICSLAENMHIRNYQKDEIVFREGDQSAGAILILEGQSNISTRHTLLSELVPGDFFGEIALAETEKRLANAVSVKPSRLVFFLKQDMEEWIETEPRLGAAMLMNLASILAHRLHRANILLEDGA